MNRKIIGILVLTLLISASIPSIGTSINIRDFNGATLVDNDVNDFEPQFPLTGQWGVDQEQTSDCGDGVQIRPPFCLAQSFIPTKDILVGVRLYFFEEGNYNGKINITVNVSAALSESDLYGGVSEPADNIPSQGTWVLFDFPDINVTPGIPYYIVVRSDGGTNTDCYCWFYNINNPYDKGEAWISPDNGSTWITLWEYWQYNPQTPEPDFCFITYFNKSRNRAINNPFLQFLQNHPNLFPILRQLFGLQN